jgi:hypothetical protein
VKNSHAWIGTVAAAAVIALCLAYVAQREPERVSINQTVSVGEQDSSNTLPSGIYLVYEEQKDVSPPGDGVMSSCETSVYRKPVASSEHATLILSHLDSCPSYRLVDGVVVIPGAFESAAVALDGKDAPLPSEALYVSSASGEVSATATTDIDTGKTTLRVYASTGQQLQARTLDPIDLKLTGYLSPIGISDDGEMVYLQEQIEHDWNGPVSLWTYAWRSGELKEVTFIRKENVHWNAEHGLDLTNGFLVGESYQLDGDGIDATPVGPFNIYVVDLKADTGVLVQTEPAWSGKRIDDTWLSHNGTTYALQVCLEDVCMVEIHDTVKGNIDAMDGLLKDWLGNAIVVQQADTLIYHTIETKEDTVISSTAEASLRYLGHVVNE